MTKEEYFPVGQYDLDRDFVSNPLMAGIKLSRYKFAAKMLSATDRVVDLGCGNGYSTYFYATVAAHATGIDLYADINAVQAKWQRDNLKFIKGDILEKPDSLGFGLFNAVTAVDVIEHFHRDDGIRIIENFAAALPTGGMMILGTPSRFSGEWRSESSKQGHFYEYEPDELRAICDASFSRTFLFSMNDELVHTGFSKLAWFFWVIAVK